MEDAQVENLSFEFTSPEIKITETDIKGEGKWLNVSGVALEAGLSRNNRRYTFENLKENDGRNFKWIVGHPMEAENHIVGKGRLSLKEGGGLNHDGVIRNTVNYPDIVESIRDGFLQPSIHAHAKRVKRVKDEFQIEGLEIDAVGLVAFPGVKGATIDYALAESFDRKLSELKESEKDVKEIHMTEEETKSEEQPIPAPEVVTPVEDEEVTSESVFVKQIREELDSMKADKKASIIERILEQNSGLNKKDLMSESDASLKLILEYEQKLAKTVSHAVVETESNEKQAKIAESGNGYSLTSEGWNELDNELREALR